MKTRYLIVVAIAVCFVFSACRSTAEGTANNTKNTSVATTAATELEIPDEISFEVSCLCDLTDPEGKTLHCGGPNDFYGTIDGTPDRMYGTNPAWFAFNVPYQEYYIFRAELNVFLIQSYSCHFSRITARGPKEVIWNPDGWKVNSDGTDVALHLYCGDDGFLVDLTFHTDADADIVLTEDSISVSGASGEAAVQIFDIKTMKSSEDQVIPVRGGALKIDLSAVPAGTVKITADGESSDVPLVWSESD